MPQNPFNAPVGLKYSHIVNAGTTTVKAGPGLLDSININSVGAASTVTMIDAVNSSGTNELGVLALGTSELVPTTLHFGGDASGATLNAGLTIVTTGTLDLTVLYR